jgi:SnoaL-like polyketide cyclase
MATTMAVDNKTFIRRYLEEVLGGNDKSQALLEKYVTDVVVAEDMIAEGDKVAVRARFQGIHSGELMGLPATGKGVDVPFQIIYQIAQSKIAQHWMSFDQMNLMKQLSREND